MKYSKILILSLVALVLSSCGQINYGDSKEDQFAKALSNLWYHQKNDQWFTTQKVNTLQGGNWVVFKKSWRTGCALCTGGIQVRTYYEAIDLTGWNIGDSVEPYYVNKIDLNQDPSNSSNFIDPLTGNIFENTEDSPKDLESLAAEAELTKINSYKDLLVNDFGFSEIRANKVSKLVNNFHLLKMKRTLNGKDYDYLSNELIGIDFKSLKKAYEGYVKGDAEGLEVVLEKASDVNNVSPEAVQELMAEILLK